MALRLTVPSPLANFSMDSRPKPFQDWLATLPLTQLFESARLVRDELVKLNRSRLNADDRLKVLETFQPVLGRLRSEIAEDYNTAPLPLPPASRQAVSLARELLIEEANSYKLALLEKSGKVLLFGARKQLIPLIEKVMRTLTDSLTLSYYSYLPTPAGVWQELHELYRYAVDQQLVDAQVEPHSPGIAAIYKQAVLLALCDPYRLPRTELPLVLRIANELAPLAELRFGALEGAQNLFLIDPESDKPPKPVTQSGIEWVSGNTWVFGTVPLVHRLSAALTSRETGAPPPPGTEYLRSLPVDLLRRLIQLWGAPPKRVFRRQPGQATVEVSVGIQRIARLLDSTARTEQNSLATVQGADPAVQEWDVMNQSAGGLKLRGQPTEPTAISVGEILAVQYRGMLGTSVGAIRWAHTFDDGTVEFGVQMLSPRAEAVSLESTTGSRGTAMRALLLPELANLQQPAALITGPHCFQEQREFRLTGDNRVLTIRATHLVEKTSCFELFQFTAS
jgi:hypothetical protein